MDTPFSPQAWGCTVCFQADRDCETVFPTGVGCTDIRGIGKLDSIVFPTGVGVYRWQTCSIVRLASFPHRRGGVPGMEQVCDESGMFSPQAWGCM